MGYASALAWLLFVVIMLITTLQVRASRRLVHYEGTDEGPALDGRAEHRPAARGRGRVRVPVPVAGGRLSSSASTSSNRLLPSPFAPQNYVEVWQKAPLLLWLGNSMIVGLAAAITVTLSSAMVAFGFAYSGSVAATCCSGSCSAR